MSNDELAIRNLVDLWCRATEAGDVDALAPLMADDMVFLTPGREPFGKREFLEGSGQSADKVKISVQADVKEVRVEGDLGPSKYARSGQASSRIWCLTDLLRWVCSRNASAGIRLLGTEE